MSNRTLHLARNLRKNLTEAEQKLWRALRKKQLANLRFRRQVPIGPFIADFICFEKHLIIEIDGGQHSENKQYDAQRTVWLKDHGFRVIRFWNNEVMNEIDAVATAIPPILTFPHKGGRNNYSTTLPQGGKEQLFNNAPASGEGTHE